MEEKGPAIVKNKPLLKRDLPVVYPEEKSEPFKHEREASEEVERAEFKGMKETQAPAEGLKAPIQEGRWIVQVAAVRTESEAKALRDQLMTSGFRIYYASAMGKDEEWNRVRAGFFRNEDEARKAEEDLKEKGYIKGSCWITRISKKEMEDQIGK